MLYLFCLAPSVATGGDCGELIAASYRLGVAHPSGYALYCLAGRAFAFIFPFGEIAWRYNVFSALCNAATAGVVTLLVHRHFLPDCPTDNASTPGRSFLPAACAGLLLAGLSFFGAQALIAEVYAPTGLAVALLIWCAAKWHAQPKTVLLAALALGLGLALNLHLSTIFLWPGLMVFFIWHWRRQRKSRRAAWSTPGAPSTPGRKNFAWKLSAPALCFLIGLSVAFYLPLRAKTFPEPTRETIAGVEYSWFQPLDWGHPADFPRWKAHVSVQQYKSLLWRPLEVRVGNFQFQTRIFAQSPSGAWKQLVNLLGLLSLQWLWSTPLVAVGAWASWRDAARRPLAALLAMAWALNVFIAVHYRVDNVFDIANFLFPAYVMMAIWMGIGIAVFLDGIDRRTAHLGDLWRWRIFTLAKFSIFAAIFLQWIFFIGSSSLRGNTRAKDDAVLRARAIETLQNQSGRKATLLMFSDDALFPFWYAQHVLKMAQGAKTPFGPAMHAFEDAKRLPELAARFLKSGPVATTQWREDVDAKFPYAPLTENGNLWRLSSGVLPTPATPIANFDKNLRAKFQRKEVRRGELIGFQADFKFQLFSYDSEPPFDAKQKAFQYAWLEVLVATRTMKLKPFPAQGNLEQTAPSSALLACKQTRRLIVPQSARGGQSLRAVVPLEIPIKMPSGQCDVWTRIVASPRDESTPWTRADGVELIVR